MPTTIKLKNSVTTTNTPTSLAQGEVAINITDKKVWVGDAATTPIQLLGAGGSASFGALTCTSLTNSGLTATRVTYATTGGLLTDSANLTFNGTTLTAGGLTTTGATSTGTLTASGVATFSAGTVSAPAITTSGDTNTGIFFPAADTIAFTEGGVESMRIDSSGNVGINNTDPTTVLSGRISASAKGLVAGSAGFASLAVYDTDNSTYVSHLSQANATAYLFNTANGAMLFGTNDTERMRITSGGSVGIGTTTPTNYGGTTVSINSPGESFLDMWYAGTRQGILVGASGKIVLVGVSTNSIAFETNGSERMRITSGGELLVGTTSNPSAGKIVSLFNGGTTDGVNIKNSNVANTGAFIGFFNSANGLAGWVEHTGSTTVAYNTSSDYRLKENIAPMTGALAKVTQLKPVTYTWKVDGSNGQGFIAHELQAIVPDCVTGKKDAVDKDGNPVYQGVDTSFLVATLTSAIQELHEIVKAQAAEIALLKSK